MLIPRRSAALFLAASLAVLAGCDTLGPEEPSGPGSIFVDLQSPNGAEGAAVFQIQEGWGLGPVTSQGSWVFTEADGNDMRVVVLMTTPGPIQFRVEVGDVRRMPNVDVIQVAGPDNQLRESLEGYEVDLFQMADRGR